VHPDRAADPPAGPPDGQLPDRVTFDAEADAAYVPLARTRPGDATVQVFVRGVPGPADIVLDFDAAGRLLGVEVIGASAILAPELLAAADRLDPPASSAPGER